ncbi:cardiolipin synthase [Microbacteriaceae bacterium 4G12]
MSVLATVTTIILILNILFSMVLIFIERRSPSTTWAWLLIFIILPIVGFVIYLLFGRNISRQKIFDKKIFTDETKKRYLEHIRDEYGCDLSSYEYKDLIMMNYKHSGAMYTQNNDITLYTEGTDKFDALIEALESATKFIHIEYYIFRPDEIGKKILNILMSKAKEGVEVKFLFDAMGSYTLNTKKHLYELKSAGVEYAAFFPGVLPYINRRINYRNHRKIVIVDGEIGFVGGFNIGDEYLGKDKNIGYWRDTHVKIIGDAVYSLEERFLLDWSHAKNCEIGDVSKYFPKHENDSKIGVQIVTSGPDHKEQYIKNGYIKIINGAKKSLFLQTPYFVPDDTLLESLKLSALSGVDIRIMIPGKPDHKFMAWAANSYILELLNVNIKVYLYEKGFLHAKTIMADSSVCSIGTANMDIRSFKLNFEVNSFIYNSEFTAALEDSFTEDLKYCREIKKEEFIKRPLIERMMESIVRLISPIL